MIRPIEATKGGDLFLLRLRYKEGRQREVGGNTPFLLDDPERAWVVLVGKLDIFAISVHEGLPQGQRRHVLRLEAGQGCFGMRIPVTEAAPCLLAVGVAGTRLIELRRDRLGKLAESAAHSPEVATLIEAWIAALSRSLIDEMPASSPMILPAEGESVLADGALALPGSKVSWVEALEGEVRFLGMSDTAAAEEGVFPLARPAWIQAVGQARLRVITTATWLERDPSWAGLQRFHTLVLARLAAQMEWRDEQEREGVLRTAEADRLTLQVGLRSLVGILRPETAVLSTGADAPLLAVCRLVGAAAGISISGDQVDRHGPEGGETLEAILRAARVRCRRVTLHDDWWRRDNGPLIAFRVADGLPVALLPATTCRYDLVDPQAGTRVKVSGATTAQLEPTALMLYRPFPARAQTARDLLRFSLHDCRRDLGMILVLGLAGGLVALLTPLLTTTLFDSIIPSGERGKLLEVAAALLVAALATTLVEISRSFAVLRLEGRMDAGTQAAVWDRLLSLPVGFFRHYTSGDLASRALGIAATRQVLTGATVSSALGAIFALCSYALLFSYDAGLALVATGLVMAILGVTAMLGIQQVRRQRLLVGLEGRLAGIVVGLLAGIPKLRVAGAERRAFALWAQEFGAQRRHAFAARRVGNGLAVFNAAAPIITTTVIFAALALRGDDGLSPGRFLGFNAALAQLLAALVGMNAALTGMLSVVPLYERVRPILQALPESGAERADPGRLQGGIEVSRVAHRYAEDGPLVLDDVSISARPGEFVAIVGPSGSGKSTLLRLLMGFESPLAGAIYYDGQDLASLDIQAVRRQLGVVLQTSQLMPGSILTNISGVEQHPLDAVWEAARLADLDEDLKRMPMGVHTVVNEGATTFSGGQRQRIMIARAVIGRPRVLLFDEATSALDSATQEMVSKSLESLQATRIVIAHRLSTIMKADRIYVLVRGRVAQSGTFAELAGQTGPFADLVKRQTS